MNRGTCNLQTPRFWNRIDVHFGWLVNESSKVVEYVGTVVRAPVLIIATLDLPFHSAVTTFLLINVPTTRRYLLASVCRVTIRVFWKSYPGATLHVVFYFTLLCIVLYLCPGASLPVVVGRAKEKKKMDVTCTRAEHAS
jgi:hypothetical protein